MTYTVELPDVQTKAIGDGLNVDQLVYEVWKTGEEGELSTRLYQKTINLAPEAPRKWIVTLNLVQNQTYKALFWAQVAEAEAYNTENLTDVYFAKNLTSGYFSNQESYAAFYGTDVLDTNTPLKGKTITLTRPFAQLNIGTLNTALVDEYEIDMLQSSVKVTVPTHFDVSTSKVDKVPAQEITFKLADVPTNPATLPVSDTEYDYVAMNYVFAGENTTSSVAYTINTTITPYGATEGTPATINKTIPNVPLKENYRTNIVGNLLTSSAQYEVVIDKEFNTNNNSGNIEVVGDGIVVNQNGDYEVSTAAGFAYAINELFADGGTFYIHPGVYDFTGIEVEPQATKPGAILNVKANEVPVVTRSTPEFAIISLNTPLVSEVTAGSQALFSGLVLPEDNKLVGVNNGVVGIANCSNAEQETGEALIGNNDNGEFVNTVSMDSVEEIEAAMEQGLKLIELTGDMTLTDIFVVSSPVTIDGCGHTLTSTAARAINVSGVDGVTIKNLNIVASGERAINIIQNATNVNIVNVTAVASNYTVNVASSAPDAEVNIESSTLDGLCTVNVSAAGADVRVNNSTVNCNDNNTTEGESYAALALNSEAIGGQIIATNTIINVVEGSDSYKGRNGAENGTVTIDGSAEEVYVYSAVIRYEGSDYYHGFATLADAIEFAKNGDAISLIRDMIVDETVVIPAEKVITIDLNGKTLVGTMHKSVGHVLKNEGTLTLKNGTISSTCANGGSAIYNAGTLVVENVFINGAPQEGSSWPSYAVNNYGPATFTETTITSNHGAVASYADATINNCHITMNGFGGSSHVFYFGEGADVVVNGGVYTHNGNVDGSLGYIMTGATITINDGTFSASNGGYGLAAYKGSITVNGGYFTNNFQAWGGPISVTGGTFNSDPTNYLAEGYQAVNKNGVYVVIKSGYDYVSTADELIAALADGKNVFFANDITVAATSGGYSKAGILQNKAQTIDGNGHTLTVTGAGDTWGCAIYTNGGIIKNLTVAGAMRGIFTAGQSSDLYIENVTFKNVIYTFNSDGKMPANPFGVYVSNSTVNGWTSHSNMHTEVVYNNCSFGEGSGYKYCRPYGTTSFVGCTFCSGYTVDKSQTSDITFSDCTFEE